MYPSKKSIQSGALALVLGGALFASQSALADINVNYVLFNGSFGSVTVAPGATVAIEIGATVTEAPAPAPNNWRSTDVTFNGATNCEDHANLDTGTGSIAVGTVTAPAVPGTYPVNLALSGFNGCGQPTVAAGGSIVVSGDTTPVPIPVVGLFGTALMGAGLAGLGFLGFRRRK